VLNPAQVVEPLPGLLRTALAGLLVGAGSGMGNGCTSGHGICGNARLAPRSMAYTAIFMATAGRCGMTPGWPRPERIMFQHLNLTYDEARSNFAYNSNLRRYTAGFATATIFNTNAALQVASTSALTNMVLPAAGARQKTLKTSRVGDSTLETNAVKDV
jgi:hypothetical protein